MPFILGSLSSRPMGWDMQTIIVFVDFLRSSKRATPYHTLTFGHTSFTAVPLTRRENRLWFLPQPE